MELPEIFGGTLYAVVGAVATRLYQPERATKDVDLLIHPDEHRLIEERLLGAGGAKTGNLAMPDSHLGLEGEVWTLPVVGELDLLWSHKPWTNDALRNVNTDAQGLAIISLPYLIAMKLDASRSVDQGDLARMLGFANDADLDETRTVVARLLPELRDDLESYIQIGKIEVGQARDYRGGRER